jgi:uncharacterized protein (UPF0332 family)
MGFDWADYLEYAEDLVAQQSVTECEARTAVSRAYYALFGCARQWLADHVTGFERPGREDHQLVWRRLEACGRGGLLVAACGETLRDRRRTADYQAGVPVTHAVAEQLTATARLGLDALGDL